MSAQTRYFKLGLFILIGFFFLTGAVIILSMDFFSENNVMMETYLNESVQGLDIGSPVKFMGVKVGNIKKIDFSYNKYHNDGGMRHRYVIIEMSIDPKLALGKTDRKLIGPLLLEEISHGLRIKIAPQGITGTAFLEMDYIDPRRVADLPIDWEPQYYYIPSTRGTFARLEEIMDTASKTLNKLSLVDYEAVFKELEHLLVSMNKAVADANVAGLSKSLLTLISKLQETNQRIGQFMDSKNFKEILSDLHDVMTKLSEGAQDLPATMHQTQRLIHELNTLVARQRDQVQSIMQNGKQMMENLNEMTNDAKHNPSSLIFGGPPKPKTPLKDAK
ncbi:MAG: MCE family protein [Desulfovibrionaceae bacterium]|nr:MCE family protein [Desulfovibrionaceae bacterium]MBF0512614.1 MCE family protein [Desulfovibrionaceae bacterium]